MADETTPEPRAFRLPSKGDEETPRRRAVTVVDETEPVDPPPLPPIEPKRGFRWAWALISALGGLAR